MSLFSKLSAVILALGALLFASAALACDNCGGGYYGGQEVYSCNNALYDCRSESSYYHPPCDDGCYRRSRCDDGCGNSGWRRGYVHGFRDGFETARYEGDDWRPHDGYHGDYDEHHDWHDGDRHDDHDGHDGDHHDGHDGHDGDHHDDHHDGDHHDH